MKISICYERHYFSFGQMPVPYLGNKTGAKIALKSVRATLASTPKRFFYDSSRFRAHGTS